MARVTSGQRLDGDEAGIVGAPDVSAFFERKEANRLVERPRRAYSSDTPEGPNVFTCSKMTPFSRSAFSTA